MFPTFFRMTPDDRVRFTAIIQLLQHFGWNWVGILTSGDGSSDEESRELSKMMSQQGICIDYITQLTGNEADVFQAIRIINESLAKVIIMCGIYTTHLFYFISPIPSIIKTITFIFPPTWNKLSSFGLDSYGLINCSFIFVWLQKIEVKINPFKDGVNFSCSLNDPIMEDIGLFQFHCLSKNIIKNNLLQTYQRFSAELCKDVKDVSFLFYTHTDFISYAYRAVYVLANVLHGMYMKKNKSEQNRFQHRLHMYLRNVHYTDPIEGEVYFNERREVPSDLMLQIWVFNNDSYCGNFHISTIQRPDFMIKTFPNMSDPDFWKKGKIPVSRCSDPCLPGSRKKFGSSIHKCCYECISCPEGEISNISDSENCMKCPDDQWPNERNDRCVPKLVEFLSYTDDPIVAVFSTVSILCCLLAGFILGIFIHYQDTPIVKGNNRNLSYLLLVSIMLSFLCVFLFLGHPVDVTCMLRVTSFGVIFSVAVSSLLAKSIMVCIAFKATKPGSSWRKWMGATLPNFIICVFSLVQIIICITWLSISPPFQDRDTHSYQGKIIIQCNEGSVIGFYSVLGYMGLLAAASFIIAFLARTLPDSFNEAKYITFSMLVFCSVWIAMIPAYLSTRGKYMVAVEVFAIMASSSGLLGCIFFPKCYIILFRPDLNTKIAIH
ncbi:vomeronasal type-2 receptor 116-like [Aquarana catesbeiana]|uniref:vomeronasal type-2 receptor 116-like n=1 Tax=Aquarana catesbeiana TaxID=8400 RepID=UPI003CC938CA